MNKQMKKYLPIHGVLVGFLLAFTGAGWYELLSWGLAITIWNMEVISFGKSERVILVAARRMARFARQPSDQTHCFLLSK